MNRLQHAIELTVEAHKNQFRKYTNEPYITHPFYVAALVSSRTSDEDMIISAYLHDVVEDTDVTNFDIIQKFGTRVGKIVCDLTDIKVSGNREQRKRFNRERWSDCCYEAKTIKLADIWHNLSTIKIYDPEFSKVYFPEKKLLLDFLKEGDNMLYEMVIGVIIDYYIGLIER